MKARKYILAGLLVLAMAAAIGLNVVREQVPPRVCFGAAADLAGTWQTEPNREVFSGPIPQRTEPQVLFLKTHWPDYSIFVDDTEIFSIREERIGCVHLFALPEGQVLTVQFHSDRPSDANAIHQSQIRLGDRSGIFQKILAESLHALFFTVLAVLMAGGMLIGGLRMRGTGRFSRSIVSLGIYILFAGIWVLTDSNLLLLLTQRTGLVELVSFLAFFSLPLPLLTFTKRMLPGRKQELTLLRRLFTAILVLFLVNYFAGLLPTVCLLITEHTLIAATVSFILWAGFREQRHHRDRKLGRVLAGYTVVFFSSITALVFFYLGNPLLYSLVYCLGILGFIFFLADAAWIELYEQIQENANVAVYARLAYLDQMTELQNRTAFMEETKQLGKSHGALGFIMVDVNGLKKINDTLGHHTGDALITTVARCLRQAVPASIRCYRIGGDEFVVILRGTDRNFVSDLARRIRLEVEAANGQSSFPVSVSLGWSWSENPGDDPEALFRQADNAMYQDKKQMKAERT